MYGPDPFSTMAYSQMMAQQRAEQARVQRRISTQHGITPDSDVVAPGAQHSLTGTLRGLRASFSHSFCTLLRYARLRAGTTPA